MIEFFCFDGLNYSLSASLGGSLATQASEQKKKHEITDKEEMDEEAQMHEEPERPLKRLRLRNQNDHVSPSFGLGETSSRGPPKVEEADLPETCPEQRSQDMTQSPQPLVRNKGKQPVLPKPVSIQDSFEPSQPGAADRTEPFATRTESDLVPPPVRLTGKGKEPLLPQIAPGISVRSPHAVRLKEPMGDTGIVLSPKPHVHDSRALIKPKDEPFTDDILQSEVPSAVIHGEPLSIENSSSANGSIGASDGPEHIVSQSVDGEARNDGVLASSNERRTDCKLANNVDGNWEPTHANKSQETIMPAVDLLKQSNALDALGARSLPHVPVDVAESQIPRLPSSSNGTDDCTQTDKNTIENIGEIDEEKEQNSLEHANPHSLLVQQPDDIKSLHDANDIAKGQERVVISLVNEVNNECPPSFHYIPKNAVFQNAYVNFSLARIGENCCSICLGDCLSSSTPCACANETGGDFAYTLEGLVKDEFLEECISMNRDPQKHCHFYCKECPLERSKNDDIIEPCKGHLVRKFIKECWWKCGCSKQCGNRVVQRGISCNLQVFMTPGGKGWGLRTLEDLPKGAFVCEYVGEILTNAELFERVSKSPSSEEHAYPVLLDADWGSEGVLKDEEALCLDATHYGNVARFINHRCFDSNLVEIPVEVETPDHHYYHLAFFTSRKVQALEELTWDYGIDFDDHDHPVKAFKCRCGSKFCRNIKRSSSVLCMVSVHPTTSSIARQALDCRGRTSPVKVLQAFFADRQCTLPTGNYSPADSFIFVPVTTCHCRWQFYSAGGDLQLRTVTQIESEL
ncbi:hypothetical protein HYC85_025704 [Camellia sinensis]|uniref:SET domain-containing protein n=1 Tax=Camellia sinensis TaxID=4442 RepID=A0A7J7GFN4_CAMSI|nr:hypothetical protein HYC85_025704 [Camellia sinensis]